MRTLADKTALITGGGRGIGRAIAERLADEGAVVAVNYARDAAAADDVVRTITKNGGAAFTIAADLGTEHGLAALWDGFDSQITEHAPGTELDILVNNAGIGDSSDIHALTPAEFDRLFAVNVKAPFFIVQHALPRMRDGGRIINISSGVTRIALPEIIGYTATKGAIDTFTRNLAKELGPRGITVNAVAPGIVETDGAHLRVDDPQVRAELAAYSVFDRVGQPDDVADVVAFVASHDARWVSGQVLDATGGSQL